jgi:hypothetical protein
MMEAIVASISSSTLSTLSPSSVEETLVFLLLLDDDDDDDDPRLELELELELE